MKRMLKDILAGVGVFTLAALAWLFVYQNTKNADNLPTLESLRVEELGELVGYKRGQLISVWGQPDDVIGVDQDVWKRESGDNLIVTYKANKRVREAVFAIS